MEKLSEPMLNEASSGLIRSAGASRWSRFMVMPPPVVMVMTAFVAALIAGRNCMQTAGSPLGSPVLGSRAWKCNMAAPAGGFVQVGLCLRI
jgi:hypothetical protein